MKRRRAIKPIDWWWFHDLSSLKRRDERQNVHLEEKVGDEEKASARRERIKGENWGTGSKERAIVCCGWRTWLCFRYRKGKRKRPPFNESRAANQPQGSLMIRKDDRLSGQKRTSIGSIPLLNSSCPPFVQSARRPMVRRSWRAVLVNFITAILALLLRWRCHSRF